MEDFILREIDRIGELLQGLLRKLGLHKRPSEQEACALTKVELAEKFGMDIDTLIGEPDFIATLTRHYGFGPGHLEMFAELLADLAAAAGEKKEQCRLAAAACALYQHLDAQGAPASFRRYYILKELQNYNR